MAIEETVISSFAIVGAAFIAFYGIPYKMRRDAEEHDRTALANAKERDRTALADKKYDLFFPGAKSAYRGLWGLSYLINLFTLPREGERGSVPNLMQDLALLDYSFVKAEIHNQERVETEEARWLRLHIAIQEKVKHRQEECARDLEEARAVFMLLATDQRLAATVYECENMASEILNEIVFQGDGLQFEAVIMQPKIEAYIAKCEDTVKRIREELERIRAPLPNSLG